MGFKEISAVPCLPGCRVDVACLAAVDDMHPQLPNLLHPCLFLFDVGKQMIRLRCRFLLLISIKKVTLFVLSNRIEILIRWKKGSRFPRLPLFHKIVDYLFSSKGIIS